MRARPAALILAVTVAACARDAAHLTAPPDAPPPPPAPAPTLHLVVLDSTALSLSRAATDRAGGHFVFTVLGAVPTLAPGDYIAVKQGGLYLGVLRSASQAGNVLTLELAPADWDEVFKPFDVRIPLTKGAGSAPSVYGEVRWGPWYLVGATQAAPAAAPPFRTAAGAPVNAADFDPQDFFLNNFDLCVNGGIVSVCNISARVVDAHFSLTGDVDVGADIDVLNGTLNAHAFFNQQLNTGLTFQVGGTGQIGVEVPIGPGFARNFTVGPFSGKLTVGIIIGLSGSVQATIEPHIAISDTVRTGGSVSSSDGFNFAFNAAGHFDAGVRVVDLGDAGVKLSLGPKAEVTLDIADGGFSLGAGADGFAEGTANLAGLLGYENWHVLFDVGTEAFVEGGVHVPLIGLGISAEKTFPGPGINLVELWGTGDLDVTTATQGSDVFPGQQYLVSVARAAPGEPPPWATALSSTLGGNDHHRFDGGGLCHQYFPGAPVQLPSVPEGPQDCDLVATGHLVHVSGIAWNCAAAEPLPAPVTVRPRDPFDATARLTRRTVTVTCRSAFVTVRDRIGQLLAAGEIDNHGVANALQSQLAEAERLRDGGAAEDAGRVVAAFTHLVRAQTTKHITAAAAAELQDLATLLEQCYLTTVPTCSTVAPSPVAAGD